jgi:hypothetical protein
MTKIKRIFLGVPAFAIGMFLVAGCGGKNDAINQAENKDASTAFPSPASPRPKTSPSRDSFMVCRS